MGEKMNREIKFRAWDGEGMIFNSQRKEYDDYYTLDLDGTFYGHTRTGDEYFNSANDELNKKKYTLMQYTGLKDKNGKEIYEGDLLVVPAENEWEKENYSCFEVFFHDGDANSDYNIGFTMNRMHNHGSIAGGYIPSFKPKTISKMIVIGNIYENPELV